MIAYTYDYHRLTGISYSDHPENNVKYYYGGRNASHNRIGRLMMREDRTGAIEYFYDKMGEVTKITARLQVDDNGFVPSYWHDADGERTVKTSGEGEQVYVNSEFAGGRTNTAKFSLYVSPYLDIPCWNFCIRPSYLPSAMSWTSWSARLSSLALNLPKVLASHTNQSATCFKVALASSANIFR